MIAVELSTTALTPRNAAVASADLVCREYVEHYHTERPHQAMENRRLIETALAPSETGEVVCRERLGGVLRHYHRGGCGVRRRVVQPSTSERFRLVTAIFLTLKTGGMTGGVAFFGAARSGTTFFAGVAGRLAGTGASVLWMTTGFGSGLG